MSKSRPYAIPGTTFGSKYVFSFNSDGQLEGIKKQTQSGRPFRSIDPGSAEFTKVSSSSQALNAYNVNKYKGNKTSYKESVDDIEKVTNEEKNNKHTVESKKETNESFIATIDEYRSGRNIADSQGTFDDKQYFAGYQKEMDERGKGRTSQIFAYPLDINPTQDHMKISRFRYQRADVNLSKPQNRLEKNALNVRSTFISATRLVVGATDTPSDVSDFNISMVGSNQMSLNWTAVNDLDIEFYEIRYSIGSGSTAWFSTSPLVQVPRRKSNSVVVNALKPPFNLYIKAVDKLGNESANPAIITSSVIALQSFTDISSIQEETAFSGTFTNTFRGEDNNNNPAVTLDTITLFDSRSGNFDDADSSGFFFDTGGLPNNIIGSGNYVFANTFSLDAIYDATFQVELTMQSDDPYDLFDSGRGASLFDNAKAPFDGNAPTNNNAIIQIGADDSSLANITSFSTVAQQGTFKGRFFKFRTVLSSADNNARPVVTGLKARLVLEKRSETGDDISSGSGTKSVTFTNGFFQIPNITVTGQDLSSGDFFVISNKSKTGFDIVFKNSSNSIINKTFDFNATGVGLKS